MRYTQRPCRCGSGLDHRPLFDGYNIFLTYVCDQCEATRLKEFRPDIMSRYHTSEPIEPES
jgi:hypothetical protein